MKWMILPLVLILVSCTSNKDASNPDNSFFPVSSFIKSQVAMVDTTLNSIMKVVTHDGTSDTSYITRQEFRSHASDFLSLPDLSSAKLRDQYTETQMFDQELKSIVLNYTPKEKGNEIQRQEVIIEPNEQKGDKVKTIYVDQLLEGKGSTVQKRMTWGVDQYFQVVTITKGDNAPEQVKIVRLSWNETR